LQIHSNSKFLLFMKNLVILGFFLVINFSNLNGQTEEKTPDLNPIEELKIVEPIQKHDPADDVIHDYVQKPPKFQEGDKSLTEYFAKNLKCPENPWKKNTSGLIIVSFVVNIDGSLSEIRIIKDPGFGPDLKLTTLLENMPKWEPAIMHDRKVRCRYSMPINLDCR
jgi:hypothetical protein